MTYAPGDIVRFENAVAGKVKFHLCICVVAESTVHSFIFLNSEGAGFRDQFAIDCDRIPDLPKSRTGQTVFDCPTVHRKSADQLSRLRPKLVCKLPKDVAAEFVPFAKRVSSMTGRDQNSLLSMLADVISA